MSILDHSKWIQYKPEHIHLVHAAIPIQSLPAHLDGFTIGVISDLHLGTWGSFERVKKAAMMLADLSSDLVIVAGDLTSKPEAEPLIDEVLSPIGEAYGVLGNWDYRYPPTSRLQSKIKLL